MRVHPPCCRTRSVSNIIVSCRTFHAHTQCLYCLSTIGHQSLFRLGSTTSLGMIQSVGLQMTSSSDSKEKGTVWHMCLCQGQQSPKVTGWRYASRDPLLHAPRTRVLTPCTMHACPYISTAALFQTSLFFSPSIGQLD
jgi:hypothetical protein